MLGWGRGNVKVDVIMSIFSYGVGKCIYVNEGAMYSDMCYNI